MIFLHVQFFLLKMRKTVGKKMIVSIHQFMHVWRFTVQRLSCGCCFYTQQSKPNWCFILLSQHSKGYDKGSMMSYWHVDKLSSSLDSIFVSTNGYVAYLFGCPKCLLRFASNANCFVSLMQILVPSFSFCFDPPTL